MWADRGYKVGRVIKFARPKGLPGRGRDNPVLMIVGIASAFAVGALAYVAIAVSKATTAGPVSEPAVQFEMCGRVRQTCVVDGDTIWLKGQNLRLASYAAIT